MRHASLQPCNARFKLGLVDEAPGVTVDEATDAAPQRGHLTIEPHDLLWQAGSIGCLPEAAPILVRHTARLLQQGPHLIPHHLIEPVAAYGWIAALGRAVDPVYIRAGEDRAYVDRVANVLGDQGVKVFYDLFEEVELWGKNLYDHLSDLYQKRVRFTVIFISRHYAEKLWTQHERKAAQARAFLESQEYVLPARFDDTEIPGVLPTTAYILLKDRTPEEFASLITKKLVAAGATIPSVEVRRDFTRIQSIPRPKPTELSVYVADDKGTPISGATVTALADNNTVLNANSAADGSAILTVQARRSYRLLIAHPDFPAALLDRIDPIESVRVTMQTSHNIGSLVVHGTGYIPGLAGRLNPILDTANRTYLYADNIAINGGRQQPVTFAINEPIELEDCNGNIYVVTVKLISGRTALLQYVKPKL